MKLLECVRQNRIEQKFGEERFPEENLYLLDLLKFVCAFLVIIVHIPPLGDGTGYEKVNFIFQNIIARVAVPVYFTASGFLFFRKEDEKDIDNDRAVRYIKRLVRLYVVWSMIYFPINVVNIIANEDGVIHGILLYIRNFLFVGSYTHLWYLNALIVAMIVILIMHRAKVPIRIILLISFALYCLGLLGQTWYGVADQIRAYYPLVWKCIELYRKIFVTTRNGIFEGICFVSIGMALAWRRNLRANINISLIGLSISTLILFCEAYFVTSRGVARYYDIYIMLVPIVYFLFSLIVNINVNKNGILLRQIGTLIFFLHMWIKWILLRIFPNWFHETCLLFIVTTLLSVFAAYAILYIGEKNKLVKMLYS